MIIDSLLELANNQAVTTSAVSQNTIDFKQKNPNLGGSPTQLYAVMTIQETFVGATDMSLHLQDSAQETVGFERMAAGMPIPLAQLKAGYQYVLPLSFNHKRYVRGMFSVSGTATAGKVSLHIVQGLQHNPPQPDSPRVWGGK